MTAEARRAFGREVLGPVIGLFLARLHAHLAQADDGRTRILFALRAGLRIERLYRLWCEARGVEPPEGMALLKASRLMASKAAFAARPDLAVTAIGAMHGAVALRETLAGVLRPAIESGRVAPIRGVAEMPLHEFAALDVPAAEGFRAHLEEQSALYARYLASLADGADRFVLVDSGWQGTTQLLLEAGFPDYGWEGLYLGCIGRKSILGTRPGAARGLVFDSPVYDPKHPETALITHRHLIESLLEPGLPSIEAIAEADIGAPLDPLALEAAEMRAEADEAIDGVREHVAAHAGDPPAAVLAAFDRARERLARILTRPEPEEVALAMGKPRSHDAGREGAVDPVMPPEDRFEGDSAERRIEEALWPAGQAAIELGPRSRERRQRAIAAGFGADPGADWFAAKARAVPAQMRTEGTHVAIVTRTKDRPLLLARAAESVAAQTHRDYSWVVVNDGGALEPVMEVVCGSGVEPARVTVCSNDTSRGMEAASNIGIRAVRSEYVVIHDDDDSWHPDFLETAVGFLARSEGTYDGAITKTLYVSEEIRAGAVVEHGRWPYNDWVENVQLSEMAVGNIFAPIAFLYRRRLWEALGGYDETLPVLGDWDFNLRFLMRADIAALPQTLAHYHHRDRGGAGGAYANSVTGGISKHAAYAAILRNAYLRRAAWDPAYGPLAALIAEGYGQADLRHRLNAIGSRAPEGPTPAARLESARRAVQRQQRELDRRWTLLQIAVGELCRIKGLAETPSELLARLERAAAEKLDRLRLAPPADFDETAYLAENPDVAERIAAGDLASGFEHFMKFGRDEGRRRTIRSGSPA